MRCMLPNAFGCGIVQAPAGQNLPTSQQNHNFTLAVHEAAHTIAVLIQCQIAASAVILAKLPFELVLHVHVSDVTTQRENEFENESACSNF